MWFCDANGAIQWHKLTEQFQILSPDSAESGNEEESDSSEEGSTLSLKKQLSVSIKNVVCDAVDALSKQSVKYTRRGKSLGSEPNFSTIVLCLRELFPTISLALPSYRSY